MKTYIETEIIPQYETFDKAHRIDHVRSVIERSLELASHYDVNRDMVYVIAAYHDIGLCEGRELHHLVSGRMLLADQRLRQWFSEEQLATMSDAAADHRASLKHEPRTIYGKIVAEADRLIDTQTTLRRAVQYGIKQQPDRSREWHYLRFVEHLTEKYTEGGYLKLWIPESDNAMRLIELRILIGDTPRLRAEFDRLFDAELL